jgi:hypothetical protein
MAKTTSVKCPNCSAPLDNDSITCEYCGARVEISEHGTKVVLAGVPCPECGLENDPDQRFCGSCDAALVDICPRCGEANRLGFRYCGACGSELPGPLILTAPDIRQAAIGATLLREESHDEEFRQLYGHLASPDETLILGSCYHEDPGIGKPYTYCKNFMATDRCLYFQQPLLSSPPGPRQESVARRVPYENVRSLTLDESGRLLIIEFDSESAGLSPVQIAGHIHTPAGPAHVIVGFLEPLLPRSIQRQWPSDPGRAVLFRQRPHPP